MAKNTVVIRLVVPSGNGSKQCCCDPVQMSTMHTQLGHPSTRAKPCNCTALYRLGALAGSSSTYVHKQYAGLHRASCRPTLSAAPARDSHTHGRTDIDWTDQPDRRRHISLVKDVVLRGCKRANKQRTIDILFRRACGRRLPASRAVCQRPRPHVRWCGTAGVGEFGGEALACSCNGVDVLTAGWSVGRSVRRRRVLAWPAVPTPTCMPSVCIDFCRLVVVVVGSSVHAFVATLVRLPDHIRTRTHARTHVQTEYTVCTCQSLTSFPGASSDRGAQKDLSYIIYYPAHSIIS